MTLLIDTVENRIKRLRKSVLTSARLIQARLPSAVVWVPVMVTLTYRPGVTWEAGHIRRFVDTIRQWGRRAGWKLPILWVMELHKSGVPHYHVLVWMPRRLRLPRSDSRGWWPHGATNTVRARNGGGYLAKYASKGGAREGFSMPKGARIFGVSGMHQHERRVVAWWHLPKRLRIGSEGSVYWRRLPGGAWENADTGQIEFAEYRANVLSPRWVSLVPDPLTRSEKEWRFAYAAAALEAKHAQKRRLGPIVKRVPDLRTVEEVDNYARYEKARAAECWLNEASWRERLGYFEAVEKGTYHARLA